jgi:hypothetical protein
MSIKFTKLSQILVIATIASLCSVKAMAGDTDKPVSLRQAFDNTYFDHTGNAFQNAGILGQLNHILGFTFFPDKQIVLDAKKVDKLYRYGMKEQTASGVTVKTVDLANPYDTSLQENPDYISE